MKHLTVEILRFEGRPTFVRVVEQTHRSGHFGHAGNSFASDGFELKSCAKPECFLRGFYVRSSSVEQDMNYAVITDADPYTYATKLSDAVRDYNETFAVEEEESLAGKEANITFKIQRVS